jgi:Rrf2 family protein
MHLSRAANYSFQALSYLAAQEPKRLIPSYVIAKAQGIPEKFLLKLLKPLATAGIVASLRGPSGGYCLARPPRAVSLLEVVEAVDGPMRGDAPLSREGRKGNLDGRLDDVCQQIAAKVRRHLSGIRLADLLTNGK